MDTQIKRDGKHGHTNKEGQKTMENDGYEAVKVGFLDADEKRTIKPKMGVQQK